MKNYTSKFMHKTSILFSLIFIFIASFNLELKAQDPLVIEPNGNVSFSGKVGIGTSNPNRNLSIFGSSSAYLNTKTGNGINLLIGADDGGGLVSTMSNHDLQLRAGGNSTKMTIKSSGKVGVGTPNPIAKLDIMEVPRTKTHPRITQGLYVTGDFGPASSGVEFRHTNGTQGLGFGYNSIYAAASQPDQHINLMPKGIGGVGISVADPAATLDVNGMGWFRKCDAGALPAKAGAGLKITTQKHTNVGLIFAYDYTQGKPLNISLQEPGGNVGIGTSNPNKAKLEVYGTSGNNNFRYAYLVYTDKKDRTGTSGPYSKYSIYANGRIACQEFNSFSDSRIKNILTISKGDEDLSTLMNIEVTDYTYKDVVEKGDKPNKKVIAQQLAKVYPQAVSTNITEVIPDIYQRAELKNGWVNLSTNLQKGERVKLITEADTKIYEILEVEPNRFKILTDSQAPKIETVFVYGREVDDFHAVDYDAISMLNVSATQELARQIKQLQKEKDELQAQNENLQSNLNNIYKRLQNIEAGLQISEVTVVNRD